MNDLLEVPDSIPGRLREPLASLSTDRGRKFLWWAVGLLFALAFLAFLALGANGPEDPSFANGNLRLTAADGSTVELCVLVADDEQERSRGLMGRTELGRYGGMAFVFEDDTASAFYMRNTPMPLTIAWFQADGTFVSAADMDPCADTIGCPQYFPSGRYRLAVEVPRGSVAFGPGSTARLGGRCA